MRPVRKITEEEENFRLESVTDKIKFVKRDPVEPEPVGTIIITAFRITGYDPDCDGSLMARLQQIDKEGIGTGWEVDRIGLYPDTELVVTPEELPKLWEQESSGKRCSKHKNEPRPSIYFDCIGS